MENVLENRLKVCCFKRLRLCQSGSLYKASVLERRNGRFQKVLAGTITLYKGMVCVTVRPSSRKEISTDKLARERLLVPSHFKKRLSPPCVLSHGGVLPVHSVRPKDPLNF